MPASAVSPMVAGLTGSRAAGHGAVATGQSTGTPATGTPARSFTAHARKNPPRLVGAHALSLLLAALGSYAVIGPLRLHEHGPSNLAMPWTGLLALYVVIDGFLSHVRFRREDRGLSLTEIPLVVGLFCVGPVEVVLAAVASVILLHAWRQQVTALVIMLDVSVRACSTAAGAIAFYALPLAHDGRGVGSVWPALAAAGVANVTTVAASSLAAWLLEGRSPTLSLPYVAGSTVLVGSLEGAVGVLAVIVAGEDFRTVWLLGFIGLLVLVGIHIYSGTVDRFISLNLLYEFTKVANDCDDGEDVLVVALLQARDLLRALRAEALILTGADTGFAVRVAEGDVVTRRPLSPLLPEDWPLARVLAEGRAVSIPRMTRDGALRTFLNHRGLRDCVLVPLRDSGGVIGVFMVSNRDSEGRSFEPSDLRLLETVANHTGAALERAHLLERLRKDALSDALTGLPNRAFFQQRTTVALAEAVAEGQMYAVMLMDLNGFKDINDSLGHHQGDVLLHAFAERLRDVAGAADVVARLGGDEFVVCQRVDSVAEAEAIGRRIRDAQTEPYDCGGLHLSVTASLGIAVFPDHGRDVSTLLRRADVAMYGAKKSHLRVSTFAPEHDQASPRRITLVAELRHALEHRQLGVSYQPKIDLHTGLVIGAEALLRWQHPEEGQIPPAEFIPIAEQTGLIKPITTFVLEQALEQHRRWLAAGLTLGVAVNLSVRNLLDESLPDQLSAMLAHFDVEPGRLTLEIAESALMTESERAIPVMRRLAESGVRLAVDDYGTGYSSLTYLRRLPIREVKIDKSFVGYLGQNAVDVAIVRSIVFLGESLQLTVVAKGVEDERVLEALRSYGCRTAQGFHLGRPQHADHFVAWVRDWNRRARELGVTSKPSAAVVPGRRLAVVGELVRDGSDNGSDEAQDRIRGDGTAGR